jgi:hypothetical protein
MTIETIEQARKMLADLQSKLDKCHKTKILAQSIAFELKYDDDLPLDDKILKAQVFSSREELYKIIKQRDKLKESNRQLRAENNALREFTRLNAIRKD